MSMTVINTVAGNKLPVAYASIALVIEYNLTNTAIISAP